MEVVIASNPDAVGALAADTIVRLIAEKPTAVLGLATGSSPLPLYRELIQRSNRSEVTFEQVTCFLLDEYIGLPENHPETYISFIRREFASHIDLQHDRLNGLDGAGPDPMLAPTRYEEAINDAGGIDLQLLGIGSDGHIGFNEPVSSLGSRARIKTLTQQTREDNARFFDNDVDLVPQHVLTLGIGTILEARHILLIATGENKAGPVRKMIEGPVAAMVPASALQFHPHVSIILDEDAAQDLANSAYYREAFAKKPGYQFL